VRPSLTEEPASRATQLSKTFVSDLDSHDVTDGTIGIANLLRAVEGLHQCLAGSFKIRESR
jgi:hypothetical protein